MKRSTDNRRSPAEIKIDLQKHYGGLEDHAPDQKAAERFRRKPYTGVRVLIRRQGEQIGDVPCVNRKHTAWIEDAEKYIAGKYGIRGDADGQERTERIRRHERGNQGSETEDRRRSEEN